MTNIYPKCLSGEQQVGHTARGYILPCCWWDRPNLFNSEIKDLVKEKFKLTNVDSVAEIFESEEWKTFYENLANGIAPSLCHTFCGGSEVKKTIHD